MTSSGNNNGLPAAAPVVRLVDELHKLPGIGAKNAQRLTYHLVRMPAREARALAEAILAVKDLVSLCVSCQNITDQNPCPLCANPNRDRTTICVVEEPLDVLAVERSNAYRGLYHVLHGAVSPMSGIGPDELKMAELIDRLKASADLERADPRGHPCHQLQHGGRGDVDVPVPAAGPVGRPRHEAGAGAAHRRRAGVC